MSATEISPQVLSVTEASERGIAKIVKEASEGSMFVVERHHKPVAAVIGIERLRYIEELEEDLIDMALVLARVATSKGSTVSLEEVLEMFGDDRAELEAELAREIAAGEL